MNVFCLLIYRHLLVFFLLAGKKYVYNPADDSPPDTLVFLPLLPLHGCRGIVITRKGQNVVVRMSALGKVLEVHPRDIELVHQAQRMLDQREKVEAEARALKKRRYDLLQGKWCNSDGLHIEVKDKYATFLHSNTPYRIIFEAEPPVLMIGKVE